MRPSPEPWECALLGLFLNRKNIMPQLIAYLFIVIIAVTLGGYCFDYCLENIGGLDVPWGWDVLGGLVTSQFVIPIAIIILILDIAGVEMPLIATKE